MRVKICGMRSQDDVRMCAAAGADALGFIFADGPRQLTIEAAAALTTATPPFVTCVGVFANTPEALVWAAVGSCRLDVLQFSGDETPEFCGRFARPTLLVARERVPDDESLRAARAVGVLADAATDGAFGGSGRLIETSHAISLRHAARGRTQFVLAGGLTPANVADVIRAVRPDAVDVRSGVERDGVKDPALVPRFVRAAREAIADAT